MTTAQEILTTHEVALTATAKPLGDSPADALVLGVGHDGAPALPGEIKAGVRRRLTELAQRAGASGTLDRVVVVPAPEEVRASLVVFTGLGRGEGDERLENLRRAAGAAVRGLQGRAASAVVAFEVTSVADVQAVAEGIGLGAFEYTAQKARTRSEENRPLVSAAVFAPKNLGREAKAALTRAAHVTRAVRLTRTLVDLSPDTATPEFVADVAVAAAKGTRVKVEVLAEKELARGSYGGLLGVGQGSVNGPRLVKLRWSPARAQKHVALVGKGITFDSGGLSLKPPASMMTMKSDMAGAAAVLSTVFAAAALELPVAVTGWLCLAENLPSGSATRPGDVLTMHSGHTVEVLNTDAEGRLVLADGLWAAGQENPDVLVDIATLTGAQMAALGVRTAGVMGDDAARGLVVDAAARAGEPAWPMPLPEHLRPSLDSFVADLKNMGDKHGGMLVAGLFLREFVPEHDGRRVPWAHIDIAGPSFNESQPWGYTPKEGTGFGVRTLLQLAESHAG
ncbi:leucyl aminopeptidase [Kocuria tytonis]|uniref:Probable cytosol aminopeptidase n=1 Tax=Kocuria tytonis TaxID=2054280 RepID=A0A495A8J4_9MICC|nr:leucyl aminopeptidase [Kocuria tytonis]RKQ36268.1 leucyl aminopeptidase [Kocuria tytonis]